MQRRRTALAIAFATTAALTVPAHAAGELELEVLSTHTTGSFDESASEITAFDATTNQVAVVNAEAGALDVMTLDESGQLSPTGSFSAAGLEAADGSVVDEDAEVNSVDVLNGRVAVAVEAGDKVSRGWVVLGRLNEPGQGEALEVEAVVRVGAQPDMVKIAPDGSTALTADEGEPDDDFTVDPVGSVSVIDLSGEGAVTQEDVRTAGFDAFEGENLPEGVRVFGPDVPAPDGRGGRVARNLEPEYVAIDAAGETAMVTLQEANAVAEVDIASATVTALHALPVKDWNAGGNVLDPTKDDDAIVLGNWPVLGLLQPDAIEAFEAGGQTYYAIANEGDAREWGEYSEETKVEDVELDPEHFEGDLETLQSEEQIGELKITTEMGSVPTENGYTELHAFGGRSFSILDADGQQVFESGGQLARIVEQLIASGELPEHAWNANNDETPSMDKRSDDKGIEPEAVTIGEIDGRTYMFLGLERISGIMVFDVTEPASPQFVTWADNRGWEVELDGEAAEGMGDMGPEGLEFVPAEDSPTGAPLLVVGNEVSGTTTVWSITGEGEENPIIDTGRRAESPAPVLGLGLLTAGGALLAARRVRGAHRA
ncbi:hypothetical protein SAMN05445756_1723 [Kytococcus aerolatus]|uniref:Choice-of-anchor I domain-containing protein n=1 Tax=Kytococcus aerolatus TaxID=592308 RepID=A0A212U1I0_9MICO|nr:choice-of-anchor I family protein [Kytococcus aerolatus]SNC72093.1 hypothetical protein SAMN05445756_1723 [Kytococcus aerolatus]